MAGDALIRHGEPDRTLYFVLHGQLEVIAHSGDGLSMGRLALVGAGSVLGEQSFFDGGPRSAGAWAVDDCEVAAMTPDQYTAFEQSSPALARELSSRSAGFSDPAAQDYCESRDVNPRKVARTS